jgi:hypothetical protein
VCIFVVRLFGKFIFFMGVHLENGESLLCKKDVKGFITKGNPYIVKSVDDLCVWVENDRGFVHQFTMDRIDEFFDMAMHMKYNDDNMSGEKIKP